MALLACASAMAAEPSAPPAARARPAYRANVPVTRATSSTVSTAAPRIALPEYGLRDRRATLRRDDQAGWYVLDFQPQAGQPDVPGQRVLPCPLLSAMEQAQEQRGSPVFVVGGESTRYHGHQYLLVRDLLLSDEPADPSAQVQPPASPPPAPPAGQAGPAGTVPTEVAPAGAPAGGEVSSAQLLERMMQGLPAKPLGPAPQQVEEPQPAAPSMAPGASRLERKADRGDMVVDRLGWIVPSRGRPGWFEFRFVSDNTLDESPLLILPSLLLQRHETAARKVRMSGEVVGYHGRTYLLLRKLLVERDMDQF